MATPAWTTGYAPGGYTGGVVSPLPLYGGGGVGGGGMAGLQGLLQRAWAMKQRQADAELRLLEDELAGRKWQRQQTERAQSEAKTLREEAKRERGRGKTQIGRAAPEDRRWQDAYGMAESLASTSPFSPIPNQTYNLARMIKAIGPQAAHEGLMQSGALLGSQAGVPASMGQMRARGMEYRPGETLPVYGEEGNIAGYQQTEASMVPQGAGRRYSRSVTGAPYRPLPSYARSPLRGERLTAGLLGSREKGGTIPKTGTYRLHKGEVVVPRKDVSPALIAMLTRRKLLERTSPKDSAPLGSYQGGSYESLFRSAESGDVPSFREILRSMGTSEEELDQFVNSAVRNPLGHPLPKEERASNIRTRLKELGEKLEGYMPDWLAAVPYGQVPVGLKKLTQALGEGEGVPQAVGGAVRGVGGAMAGAVLPAAEEVLSGLTGAAEETPPTGEEATQPPATYLAQAVAEGAEPPEGTYEAARKHVLEGHLGTPEAPLRLEGKLSDFERAQREVESLPAYQDAQRKALQAEQESESLYTTLLTEGRAFDPQVYQQLAQEAKRKEQLGKSFRGIMERFETANEKILAASQSSTQAILRDIIREGAMGNRMEGLERLRQQGALDMAQIRGMVNSLPGLWRLRVSETPGGRERAAQEIARVLQIIATAAESREQDPARRERLRSFGENAAQNAQEFLGYDADTMMNFYGQLLQQFGGASELNETLGGQP